MKHLEPHQQQQIIILLDLEVPIARIAQAVRCSRPTVYAIAENLELWDQPYPPRDTYRLGRLPILSAGQIQWLLEYLAEEPTAYYDEIAQFLHDEFEIQISHTQLRSYLKKARYSRKAVRRKAAERNELLL